MKEATLLSRKAVWTALLCFSAIWGIFCSPIISDLPLAHAKPQASPQMKSFIAMREREKQKLQGGAFAIISQGQVIYQTIFGFQKGQENPITSETLFPLASASKPITAMAIALLVDANLLDLKENNRAPISCTPSEP